MSEINLKKTVHIIVSGKVQGVWFRWDSQQWAKSFNLTGWVKNLLNGNVEIHATGEDLAEIAKFIEKVREGTPASSVKDVEITWLEESIEYESFKIIV